MQKRLPGIFLVLALSVGFSVNSFAAVKDITIKNSRGGFHIHLHGKSPIILIDRASPEFSHL